MVPRAGEPDPRIRSFVQPARVVWTSGAGVADPEALLAGGSVGTVEGPAAPPRVCTLTPAADCDAPALLLDFGCELHGGIRIDAPGGPVQRPLRVRVRFGESASEAMGGPNQDHTLHDLEIGVPWMGHQEIGNTGFRFVRIDLLEAEAPLRLSGVRAIFLRRDLPYIGSFECNDELLNRIWRTGAYTVHLNMQDFLWDGIKRDRLVWMGDMHPETRVVSTVFGGVDVVPRSMEYVRDRTPLPGWMNGISSYSLWWIICHLDWYRYTGDLETLRAQADYLAPLVDQIAALVAEDGQEALSGVRFLEWPTSRDPLAIDAGLQALTALALEAGASLCRLVGSYETAARAEDAARRAFAVRRPATPSKQANALLVMAGMADAVETNRSILAVDPDRGVSTFYGYYILEARAMAGDFAGCLELIRSFWGGMLAMGATTFWEDFNLDWTEGAAGISDLVPPGMKDIHGDFGDFCYQGLRHSLCHGWAAGPTAWLTEYVLGLAPADPGFATLSVRPNLGGLEWARGSIPTPMGVVRVEHRIDADGQLRTDLDLPPGMRVA